MKLVGIANSMPGAAGGFTMAVFKGDEVPVGTEVYVSDQPVIHSKFSKFCELPLGTKFCYFGSSDVWVVIQRHGCGLIASYEEDLTASAGQKIFAFADSEKECRSLEVIVIR